MLFYIKYDTIVGMEKTQFPILPEKDIFKRMSKLAVDSELIRIENERLKHDHLTGALNRAGLDEHLEQMTLEGHSPEGLLFIDLTNFKAVNDKISHEEGDRTLVSMTKLLRSVIREGDILARIGGDEFVVILKDETIELEENTDMGHRDVDGIDSGAKIIYAKSRIENEMKEFLDQNDLAVGGVVWKPGDTYEKLSKIAEEEMTKYKSNQHLVGGKYRQ